MRHQCVGGIISETQKHPTRRRRVLAERGRVLWIESEDAGKVWLQVHAACGSESTSAMLHLDYDTALAIAQAGVELVEAVRPESSD